MRSCPLERLSCFVFAQHATTLLTALFRVSLLFGNTLSGCLFFTSSREGMIEMIEMIHEIYELFTGCVLCLRDPELDVGVFLFFSGSGDEGEGGICVYIDN